jgi:hypothetical protein
MNQYILTEEERKKMLKLWSVIQQHIDWQHNACHTLDLTVQDAYNLMEVVRSHPYQSEQEKVLHQYMLNILDVAGNDEHYLFNIKELGIILKETIAELRQEGGEQG